MIVIVLAPFNSCLQLFVLSFIDIPVIFMTLSRDLVGFLLDYGTIFGYFVGLDERETLHGVSLILGFPNGVNAKKKDTSDWEMG